MNHQQIITFMNVAQKYKQQQFHNSCHNDRTIEDTNMHLNNIDLEVFRKNVQQKIKNKYQEQRHLKTSPHNISKTLPFNNNPSNTLNNKSKITIHTEENDQTIFTRKRQILSHSQMHKHDSLQRFIHKKQQFFLAKSNLLLGPSSTSFKCRKSINSHLKTQNSTFKEARPSNNISKKQDLAIKLRHQLTNFGYEMDGSIYHFQDNRSITAKQSSLNQSLKNREDQKNKEEVYKMLRNTSPLHVQKKLMRQKRTSGLHQPIKTDLGNNVQRVRQSFKCSNKRHKDQIKKTTFSKMVPSLFKQTSSLFLGSKEDDISGWEFDQQL